MSWRQSGSAMRDETPSSRAMNLTLERAAVTTLCTKHNLAISAIESLLSGGTRVVLQNGDDAATLRRLAKGKLIDGAVQRNAWASTSSRA